MKCNETNEAWTENKGEINFVITSFTVGSISRRNLGANCCSSNEHRQSQPTWHSICVLFLGRLLLGPADYLGRPDVRHVALRWAGRWWSGGSRECMVVQEACSWGHFCFAECGKWKSKGRWVKQENVLWYVEYWLVVDMGRMLMEKGLDFWWRIRL